MVVYAYEKNWAYLLGSKVVVHSNHTTLRYLVVKKEPISKLISWMLFLEEFAFEVKDQKVVKIKKPTTSLDLNPIMRSLVRSNMIIASPISSHVNFGKF